MKALLLTLLLFYSCTRYSSLEKNVRGITINDIRMELSHLDDHDWRIGKKKDKVVSQSFTFMVQMPKVKESDLEFIQKDDGADAWIMRLIKVRGSEVTDLGSIYTLFKPRQVARGISGGAAPIVSLKVFYAAAYASERFRNFVCPAFGHDRKLTGLSIQGDDHPFELIIGTRAGYGEKAQLVQLTPSVFNGGNDLAGEYFVEIAAYDSQKKEIHSPWKRLPRYLQIREERVDVGSCQGERPDLQ